MENNENINENQTHEDAVNTDTVKADNNAVNKNADNKEPFNWKKELCSWVVLIAIAVSISFILTHFVIINANVPSGSMENTIMTGDRMVGFRLAYNFSDPKRGDVAIFKNPDNESEEFVKRIIGLPGDKIVIKDAKIYVNDSKKPLEEKYLPEESVVEGGTSPAETYQNLYAMLF